MYLTETNKSRFRLVFLVVLRSSEIFLQDRPMNVTPVGLDAKNTELSHADVNAGAQMQFYFDYIMNVFLVSETLKH